MPTQLLLRDDSLPTVRPLLRRSKIRERQGICQERECEELVKAMKSDLYNRVPENEGGLGVKGELPGTPIRYPDPLLAGIGNMALLLWGVEGVCSGEFFGTNWNLLYFFLAVWVVG